MKDVLVPLVCVFIALVSPDTQGVEKHAKDVRPVRLADLKISIVYDNRECKDCFETEWGISCLVEGTEKKILFDTGGKPGIFLDNFTRFGLDAGEVGAIVLSHNHWDHVGGMDAFLERTDSVQVYIPASFPDELRERASGLGANVVDVDDPVEICAGVHTTGDMEGPVREQALVIDTDRGIVVITGCAHPGIVRIVEQARRIAGENVLFVMGGFHLLQHGEDQIDEIISRFMEMQVEYAAPCHCSGDGAIERFADAYGDKFIRIGVGMVIDSGFF